MYPTYMNVLCFSRVFFFRQHLSLPLLFAYIYHGYHGYLFLLGMKMGVILSDVKGIQSTRVTF